MIEVYILNLVIFISIYMLTSVSFNLSFGQTGLLNLAHISFFGLGAYTSAILSLRGTPFFLALLLSGLMPMIFAFILSLVNRKLKGDYFTLATLAFAILSYNIVLNSVELTGGPHGLRNIPKPIIFGLDFNNIFLYAIFTVFLTLMGVFFIHRIAKSSFGRVCLAIRDNNDLAESLGKNTFKIKVIVLLVASFLTGVAGCLYASYVTFIDPTVFDAMEMITILAIVVLGGLASIKGTIVGTFIILMVPEILRFLDISTAIIGPLRVLLYSLILLVIIYYKPRGLYGKIAIE